MASLSRRLKELPKDNSDVRTREMDATERLLYMNVADAERKILYALTRGGPSTQSKLAGETSLHYTTVHKAMKSFEDIQWVKHLRNELSEKNVPMKIYAPTARLLILTLCDDFFILDEQKRKLWPHIDSIARNNKDALPLIFGKWDHFKKHGLRDYARERLELTILKAYSEPTVGSFEQPLSGSFSDIIDTSLVDPNAISSEDEDAFWTETLLYYFYGPCQFYSLGAHAKPHYEYRFPSVRLIEHLDEWLRCLCKDKELKDAIKEAYEIRSREVKVISTLLNAELNKYKSLLEQENAT